MSENLLRHETSPYLLQHRDNPVHWRPWGTAALEEARRLNRPILLSIGYAACHWCHVMAHESFEDPATADLMNRLFVNIKVDREERPDVDQIYMAALHTLGEQGGWPLTMFLTPDGDPVWGGTYFPKEARYGRPSFKAVLSELSRLFQEEPDRIQNNRTAILGALQRNGAPESGASLSPDFLDQAATRLSGIMDLDRGGVRGAPKFPQGPLLTLFWRSYQRTGLTKYRDVALVTLRFLSQGGIYDHLDGGLCRYSVDERWLVPHFEKMLYDNAQLIERLSAAFVETGEPVFRRRLEETIDWLGRKMAVPGGGFAASFDADTAGHEGATYLWTPGQVAQVLGDTDAERFCATYDITAAGNFEGANIPNLLAKQPLSDAEDREFAPMRQRLLEARDRRPQPARDDKILADWNGLAISALAKAGYLLDRPEWLELARQAYRFIAESMVRGDRLGHSFREDRLVFPGFASDTAAFAAAALSLYSATGEEAYLADAIRFTAALDSHYQDASTAGYFLTADDADPLVVRPRSQLDEATPSATAVAADDLVRLWHLTGEESYRERVDRLFAGAASQMGGNIFGHVSLLAAFDLRLNATLIAIVRPRGQSAAQMHTAIRSAWKETFLVMDVEDEVRAGPTHPAHGKKPVDGKTTVYVCREGSCSLPITEPAALAGLLSPAKPAG